MKNLAFLGRLFRDTFSNFLEDRTLRMAGALAYYSVFSMAPLILIAVGVASQFFDKATAQEQILQEIGETVGPSARDALAQILQHAGGAGNGVVATIVGVVLLLFGASGAFAELQDGLNNIWKVKPKPGLGIWELIKNRLLSITLVLGTGFLLLVSLILTAILSAVGGWMERHMPGSTWVWHILNSILSLVVVAALFAMIFKILPDAKISWRDVWMGAVVTSALFTIGKALIGMYLGRSGLAATYGAAASIVILLMWVYYSALILLFGAEFTHTYALATRRQVEPMDHAVADGKQRRNPAMSPSI
ncbi:MAG TPA: YihY/virulence factor BrkB family protein [Gemmataceae bacterium]|nr:YihY/virulence factor BrkB family protein [Gemmataceae bacterium]